MPTSAWIGREFFTNHLSRVAFDLNTVLDVGPGEGTYSTLGRHLAPHAFWSAVEIFEPYIERYDLWSKYDRIVTANVADWVPDREQDLIILGDVLEHMPRDIAVHVLWSMSQWGRNLYVSVPIIPAPQGASHGNEHEAHLHDWTFAEMTAVLMELGVVDSFQGSTVGRWWVTC